MTILLQDGRLIVPYSGERDGVLFDDVAFISPEHALYSRELRFAKPFSSLPTWRQEQLFRDLEKIPPLPGV